MMEIDPTLKSRLLDLIRQYSETNSLKNSVKNQIIPMLITQLIEKEQHDKENRPIIRKVCFSQADSVHKSLKMMNTRQALRVAEDAEYDSPVSSHSNMAMTLNNIKTEQCIATTNNHVTKVLVSQETLRGVKILLKVKKPKASTAQFLLLSTVGKIYERRLREVWCRLKHDNSGKIRQLVEVINIILRKNKKLGMDCIKQAENLAVSQWEARCVRKLATSVLTLQTSLWRLRQHI